MKGKPSVRNHWLLILSGLMWSGVGVLLNSFAIRWLTRYQQNQAIFAEIVGVALGIAIAVFGFNKIASKNIRRILNLPDKVCVFAFQEWKSYILIGVMMAMGILLRNSTFVPKLLLSPVYVGIGSALFFSSFLYYKSFFARPKKI
ncbi:MAG: hypothetical protein GXO74_06420 [Calditrichaeota bacterium]|nr:hypothetical protein [Calditrichota bacterium]